MKLFILSTILLVSSVNSVALASQSQPSFLLRGVVKRNVLISYDQSGKLTIRNNSLRNIRISKGKKEFTISQRAISTRVQKDFELITLQTI